VIGQGRRLYLADGDSGVEVVDVAPSGELQVRAIVAMPGHAKRLAVAEGRIYVAALTGGLQIINEMEADEPRLEAGLGFSEGACAYSVAVNGGLACLAAGKGGLVVVDIAGPGRPEVIGRLGDLGYVRDVAVVGGYAFLAAGQEGLLQVSLQDPAAPRLVRKVYLPQHLRLFGNAMDITVSGNTLLLANGRAGCQIFDVSEPAEPRFLASLACMSHVSWVRVFGNMAFVFDYENGIQTVDLSNPAQPCIIGNLGAPEQARGMTVRGNEAYVSLGGGGLAVIPMPVRLQDLSIHTPHELTLQVPKPAVPGNYLLNLVKGGERVVLEEVLTF
jgi:hypothetical protein